MAGTKAGHDGELGFIGGGSPLPVGVELRQEDWSIPPTVLFRRRPRWDRDGVRPEPLAVWRGVDRLELDLARQHLALPLLMNSSRLSQICACEFLPAWLSRITWSMFDVSNRRSFRRSVSGDPINPPEIARAAASGFSRFHLLYSSHMLTV